MIYSELTKTSTALARLAVTCVLSAARRLVLIFVNPLYMLFAMAEIFSGSLLQTAGYLKTIDTYYSAAVPLSAAASEAGKMR